MELQFAHNIHINYKAICLQVYTIDLCGFATKITYLAQVAWMFTFIGFLCTGETDSFPETKKKKKKEKKNVEIIHEIIAFVSTITKSKHTYIHTKKKHCRLTFPRYRVPFPMSLKYIKNWMLHKIYVILANKKFDDQNKCCPVFWNFLLRNYLVRIIDKYFLCTYDPYNRL
jgi:hypothetical protein